MKLFRNDSNADLLLKKHFLLSMLKTVLLVNMFEETMTFFFQDYFRNTRFDRTKFIWNRFETVPLNQCNVSLQKKSLIFFYFLFTLLIPICWPIVLLSTRKEDAWRTGSVIYQMSSCWGLLYAWSAT